MSDFELTFSRIADRALARAKGLPVKVPNYLTTPKIEAALTDFWQTRIQLSAKTGIPVKTIYNWHCRLDSRYLVRSVRHKNNLGQAHYEYKRKP